LAESSKTNVQRNSIRKCDPSSWSAATNFLEEKVAFSHLTQFKRMARVRGLLQI
jgi:hypothetical protein